MKKGKTGREKLIWHGMWMLAAMVMLAIAGNAGAARPMTIKVATVAPKGSVYHRVLQEMGEKWKAAQGDKARFIIYTDGSQGTEADSVRRMRVGQIHASMLTVSGLMEIDDSVVALQFIPLAFRNWEELDDVRSRMRSELEADFRRKGFRILFWGEGGWVQFFSNEKRLMPEDYKSSKMFTWEGTPEQVTIMKSIGYNPVVLELRDIVPGVQTGMIDVVPVAPMFALAGQFYRNTPHMLKVNWVPIVGATVISERTWKAMKPGARKALKEAAAEAGDKLRAHRDSIDENAIKAMQKRGLIVHEMTPEMEKQWLEFIQPVWPQVRGTLVPEDMFDKAMTLLREYRAKNG